MHSPTVVVAGSSRGVTPPSRAQLLAAEIEGRIAADALQAGAALGTIDELCTLSGLSRPTVVEAIAVLRERGAVRSKSGRRGGVFVAGAAPFVRMRNTLLAVGDAGQDVADAVELRDHLEELVVLAAARHRGAADLERLRGAVDEMAAAPSWPEFLAANWRFHERLASLCPNAMVRAVYVAALDVVAASPGAYAGDLAWSEYVARRCRVHAALVDAVADGDPERVREAVARHRDDGDDALASVDAVSERSRLP